jgi:hypothetical protein
VPFFKRQKTPPRNNDWAQGQAGLQQQTLKNKKNNLKN